MDKRRKIDLGVLFLVIVVGIFAITNAQSIGDWWHFRNYEPSSEVRNLAQDAGMSEKGSKLFWRFSPQFVSKQEIARHCGDKLGCAVGRNIYILRGQTEAEYNRGVVTASHEMLHIAYNRLSDDEKKRINGCLEEQLASHSAGEITEKLKGYEPTDRINEAHSFYGSEIPELNRCLETYYEKYFDDRAKSVRAYQNSPEGDY